jgi:trehalose 6-phosphate synthase
LPARSTLGTVTKATLPILLIVRPYEPADVFELFRAADLCIVSTLHDGMNLVAKEFVAARDDEQGVLILSDFAGGRTVGSADRQSL